MRRRDIIVRYTTPERTNHWIAAFCLILAAVNGLGSLFPSFNWLIQIIGTPQLTRILYPFVGVVMFALFTVMFFRYWYYDLINRGNIFWAKGIRKIVANKEVGDTGRYNFGQKCVSQATIIFLILLLVSGMIIWRPYFASVFSTPVIRFALMLHSFVAVMSVVVIMVHIYATLWAKGTITAMAEGWVTSAWTKKHYLRWYREVRKTTEKKVE